MKKQFIYAALAFASVLASCDEHEWKKTNVVEVPVISLKSTFPNHTDSIDIYKDQKFVIQYQNKGARLLKNDLVFLADSIDEYDYYCLNFTYTEPEGYSYEDKETGDIHICDKLVNYSLEGEVDEAGKVNDAIADITYSYVDLNGDTLELDYDYISEIKVNNKKSLY